MVDANRQMRILDLNQHKEFIPLLAQWHAAQWKNSPPDREALLLSRSGNTGLPKTFVAMHDETPIGFVCLLATNALPRLDLTPWLASLYVSPEHRNTQVGQKLVQHCLSHAASLGFDRLHLFTSSAIGYYTRLGWREMATVPMFGKSKTVLGMRC